MSVVKSKRGEGKFQLFLDAMNLCKYTLQICSNKKIFVPEFQNSLTDDIVNKSKNIYLKIWRANNIRVGKNEEEKYKKRKMLQEEAILDCIDFLALIQLAKGVFHLKTKRILYWGEQIIKVRESIKKWRDSDSKRYNKM